MKKALCVFATFIDTPFTNDGILYPLHLCWGDYR